MPKAIWKWGHFQYGGPPLHSKLSRSRYSELIMCLVVASSIQYLYFFLMLCLAILKLSFVNLIAFWQTLVTSVAQLYIAPPESRNRWKKKATGVICFVKDNGKRSYFLRMYSLVVSYINNVLFCHHHVRLLWLMLLLFVLHFRQSRWNGNKNYTISSSTQLLDLIFILLLLMWVQEILVFVIYLLEFGFARSVKLKLLISCFKKELPKKNSSLSVRMKS